MRTSKLVAAELSRNKHFVYCGAVKRDNSEPERRRIPQKKEIFPLTYIKNFMEET